MEGNPKSEPAGVPPPGPVEPEGADRKGGSVSKKLIFRRWFNRFVLLKERCPICQEYAVRWVKDWVVDPEEPPMFGHWICDACSAATKVVPTRLALRAAKDVLPNANEETRKVLEAMIKDAEASGIF